MLRILYADSYLVVIDKPAGIFVHAPTLHRERLSPHHHCLGILRRQLGREVHPVHRLDRATSGVVLFALEREYLGAFTGLFQRREIRKIYYAVVRGWLDDGGVIDRTIDGKESRTNYRVVARAEVSAPVGRYSTGRFSLVELRPETGRFHQLRRHFHSISHPILGDTVHGDSKQNRYFREKVGISGLMLKAYSLEFTHPMTGERSLFHSRWGCKWLRIFDFFGVCPFQMRHDRDVELLGCARSSAG